MKRYDQGSFGMREDANGAWCDYEEARAEIELLRTSERSAWNAAVQRDEEIERLRMITAPGSCECSPEDACRYARERDDARAEIERLRVYLSGARCPHCDELRLELGEVRGENERLRVLLREALTGETHGVWMMRVRDVLGE